PPGPPPKSDKSTHNEQGTKNTLVIAREPQRKVNIEIAGSVVRVTGRHVGERAAPVVNSQDEAFSKDQHGQPKSPTKFPEPAEPGQGEDRCRHDGPDCRMQHFYLLELVRQHRA